MPTKTGLKHKEMTRRIWQLRERTGSPRNEILAYWAQWGSLKLINGCLYRHLERQDLIQPNSRAFLQNKEVLNKFNNEASKGGLGVTKTLEKLKQRFYKTECQQTVADWVANCSQRLSKKKSKITWAHVSSG